MINIITGHLQKQTQVEVYSKLDLCTSHLRVNEQTNTTCLLSADVISDLIGLYNDIYSLNILLKKVNVNRSIV